MRTIGSNCCVSVWLIGTECENSFYVLVGYSGDVLLFTVETRIQLHSTAMIFISMEKPSNTSGCLLFPKQMSFSLDQMSEYSGEINALPVHICPLKAASRNGVDSYITKIHYGSLKCCLAKLVNGMTKFLEYVFNKARWLCWMCGVWEKCGSLLGSSSPLTEKRIRRCIFNW